LPRRSPRPTAALFSTLALLLALWLTGCSSATTGGSGGSTTGSGSTTTGHTPKAPAKIDAALCAKVMTLDEANKIMGVTATNIRVINSSDEDGAGGSCTYETAPFRAAVFVAFFANAGPVDPAAALTSNPEFKGTVTPVSGLGDKAQCIVNPIPGTGLAQYHLFVSAGTLLIDTVIPVAQPSNDTALSRSKQVAQLALSRL
jgi:uncharacterized protein YceK